MQYLKRLTFTIWILSSLTACQSPMQGRMSAASPEARADAMSDALPSLVKGGRVSNIEWADDGRSVTFSREGKRVTFDLEARRESTVATAAAPSSRPETRPATRPASRPARGRQREREPSPDGNWIAVSRNWNVLIEPAGGRGGAAEDAEAPDADREPHQVTTDGHRRFRYGTASWVYGEELDQREAMWWSPDSSKLVFYEFDERNVPEHYLTDGLTDLHTKVLTEGYPKAGESNPIANLLIYDLNTRAITRVQTGDEAERYIYNVRFAPNGEVLLFNRTNRRQDTLEVVAADLATGATRVILTEIQPCWQENAPEMKFLDDGRRFIWASEKTGWKHYELRDIDGALVHVLTAGDYPAVAIKKVDEQAGVMYYTACSGQNPLNEHLHRVNLDGTGDQRLTAEPLNHAVNMSPDGRWFIATSEAIDTPPSVWLGSTNGDRVATLASSDASEFERRDLPHPELFSFKAADGITTLYGVLHKPSDFSPRRKYPLLIDVYGGPLSRGVPNRFQPANPACERGFLIAKIDNRGTTGRGKAFETATYLKLGVIDLQDQADAVRYLAKRPYVDANRVGIFGHSYGGYMSALALLKYPDLFHVAVAGGTVTDWRNYDTIYTERFMRTPQENPDGYDAGSCLKHASKLEGRLLLLHGMVDDNVHPSNAWQLIDEFQKLGKRFDMMFFPRGTHTLGVLASNARWDYLQRHLIDDPAPR